MAMRITNQMVSGNSLRNMQKSMSAVNTRTQQLTTGKKVSKASEDPVTAIRALKLRTTVNQLEQYKKKNIPDANSWLDISTTSLENIKKRITDINEYCVQGSTDSFSTSDRGAIIDSLKQLREMIFDEGNSTYAGRYIFSGYKTDRSLAFSETDNTSIYSYDITEHFTSDDFDIKNTVLNGVDETKVDEYLASPPTSTYKQPDPSTAYRLTLAYNNIDTENYDGKNPPVISATNPDGTTMDISAFTVTTMKKADADKYYELEPDDIHIILETGEIVMGEDAYNKLKTAGDIRVDYPKQKFEAGDLRPEHYFDCRQYTVQSDGTRKAIDYKRPEDGQLIYYEVNFNQSIQVNTEGSKLINPDIANYIDDLIYVLEDLDAAEKTQTKLKAMLNDKQYSNNEDAVKQINIMLSDIDVEVAVRKENLQKTFSGNIKNFQDYLSEISAMESDIGSRLSKLEMVEVRVKEQYAEFKELKSQNEDVETDEAIIDFNEANLVYESALAATSNIMKKSLLDYL